MRELALWKTGVRMHCLDLTDDCAKQALAWDCTYFCKKGAHYITREECSLSRIGTYFGHFIQWEYHISMYQRHQLISSSLHSSASDGSLQLAWALYESLLFQTFSINKAPLQGCQPMPLASTLCVIALSGVSVRLRSFKPRALPRLPDSSSHTAPSAPRVGIALLIEDKRR